MLTTLGRTIQFWDRVSDTPVDVPLSALTLTGFREWAHSDEFPESGRVCYFGGEIFVDMSPENLETHNKCKRGLYAGWEQVLAEADIGELIVDGMLLVNEEADLGAEADGMICLYESLRAGRVSFRERVEGSERFVEVTGSPDITAEIVSNSSVRKDTVVLMDRYYQAGVTEYWLIDARKADVSFRIHARGATAFQEVAAEADGFIRSEVLGRSFRMTRRRNPVGGWRYSLEFRPSR
jgi:hypothetical protein